MRQQASILAASLASVFLTAFAHGEAAAQEPAATENVRIEHLPGKKAQKHPYLFLDWVRHGFDIRNDFRIERVHFQGAGGMDTYADLFIPEGEGPFPLAVIIPPLESPAPAERMAKEFARRGLIGARMDHVPLNFDEAQRPEDPANAFRTALINAGIFIRYADSRPDIDPRHTIAAGPSMGGMIAARLFVENQNVEHGGFMLAGAPLAPTMADSRRLRRFIERMARTYDIHGRDEMIEFLETYTAGVDPISNERKGKACDVLLVAGERDKVVLPRYSRNLSEAFGGARLIMHNGGHFGLFGFERGVNQLVDHAEAVSNGKCEPRSMLADIMPD